MAQSAIYYFPVIVLSPFGKGLTENLGPKITAYVKYKSKLQP